MPHRINNGPWEGLGAGNGLEIGTVGWTSDAGNALSAGSGENNGVYLLNVTLFANKDPTVALQTGVGQGTQLQCQLQTDMMTLPPYGSKVLVAMPGPSPYMQGHSIVLGTIGNASWKQAGNASPGDLVIPCPGGNGQLTMKNSTGGFSYVVKNGDGSNMFMSLDTVNGFQLVTPWATFLMGPQQIQFGIPGGPGITMYTLSGLSGIFDTVMGGICQIKSNTVMLDALMTMIGPQDPSTVFGTTAAVEDSAVAPGTPLLGSTLANILVYIEALQGLVTSLAASPQFTGVTPVQVTALVDAQTALTSAISTALSFVQTGTTLKVAFPEPV